MKEATALAASAWMWNLVSHVEGVEELGAGGNIWTEGSGSKEVDKTNTKKK